jgi:hypothetical protein
LLAASLWRGPLPWIHSHETLEAQGLPEAALAWHVQHFHPQETEHSVFGWHVHLSYPWDISNEPAPPAEPHSPKPRSVYDMPFVVSPASATVDVDRHASQIVPVLSSVIHADVASLQLAAGSILGRHFPEAHPFSVSLRALICVTQC